MNGNAVAGLADPQQPHILENVQTGQKLAQIQGLLGPPDNFPAQTDGGFLPGLLGGKVPPYDGKGLAVGKQILCVPGGNSVLPEHPVGGGFGAAGEAAAGPDVHHIELGGPLAPEFVDLGGKGYIHPVAGGNAGTKYSWESDDDYCSYGKKKEL